MNEHENKFKLSIVIPVYKNKDTLREMHKRIVETFKLTEHSFELIFVDDGCPEGSITILRELAIEDERVVVVVLDKNVGQNSATLTGLKFAEGQYSLIMDADLQDPPEAIPQLVDEIAKGYGAVFAGRRGKYQSFSRFASSILFKGIQHMLSGVPVDAGVFMIINNEVTEYLVSADQNYIVPMVGFSKRPMTSIPIKRSKREKGRSSYNFKRRFLKGFNTIFWAIKWKWFIDHDGIIKREPIGISEVIGRPAAKDLSLQ